MVVRPLLNGIKAAWEGLNSFDRHSGPISWFLSLDTWTFIDKGWVLILGKVRNFSESDAFGKLVSENN